MFFVLSSSVQKLSRLFKWRLERSWKGICSEVWGKHGVRRSAAHVNCSHEKCSNSNLQLPEFCLMETRATAHQQGREPIVCLQLKADQERAVALSR